MQGFGLCTLRSILFRHVSQAARALMFHLMKTNKQVLSDTKIAYAIARFL